MESLFIDAGNLFLVTSSGNFGAERFRKQRAKLLADGVLARNAEELFHPGVPGFHDARKIDGKNTYVQRFHDVFAEVFQASDFQGFLFERTVKLCVIQSDRDVARDGFDEFDVIARQKIAIDGFSKSENRNSAFANAARNEVVEVELLKRFA